MRRCTPEKDMKFMKKTVRVFYPNSICFDKDFTVYSNFYDDDYKSIFISFDACRNTTAQPDKCASPEQITQFLNTNPIYVITQKTIVNKDIFDETADDYFRDS